MRQLKYLSLVPVLLLSFQLEGYAQLPDGTRLNSLIDKLQNGRTVYGILSSEHTLLQGAHFARANADFVFIDMEHSPLDFTGLRAYLQGMLSRGESLKKGNLQPEVVPVVRIPHYGGEKLRFIIKQVLDLGAYGLIVPRVETAEQARAVVAAARYPQVAGAPDSQPEGQRGWGPGWAIRYWGVSALDYARVADVWPLDPHGEIFLMPMIESVKGVENIDSILGVPGISAIFIGPGDLSLSSGRPLVFDETLDALMDRVLEKCLAKKIPCANFTGADNYKKLLEKGYRIIISSEALRPQ